MSVSRTRQTIYTEMPDGDVFSSFARGFQSFSQLNRTLQPSAFRNPSPTPEQISHTLTHNKNRLHLLRRQIERKRDESYERYIEDTTRHRKLMQLNTLKSKLVNTLNKNVGEIKVKSLDELSGVQLTYEYLAEKVEVTGLKPQPRTGQTCIRFKDYIYVLGGHNSTPLRSVWTLNLKEQVWEKLQPSELMRSSHSVLLYKNKYAVVFGGTSHYNTFTHQREYENTVLYFFDITTGIPKKIKTAHTELVEKRKDHAAIVLGHRMLVFGGSSVNQKALKDFVYLDFKTMKWTRIEYQFGSESAEMFLESGLTGAVFWAYFRNKSSTKLASISYTDQQGLYLFGGITGQNQPNKLLQVRLNKQTPVIHRIYPEGLGPSYISPSVVPFGDDSILILSGERSCRLLYLYKVTENKYTKVECGGENLRLGGIGSSLTEIEGKFYVLFGINQKGFNSEIVRFDLRTKKGSARNRKIKASSLYRLNSSAFSVTSERGSSDY